MSCLYILGIFIQTSYICFNNLYEYIFVYILHDFHLPCNTLTVIIIAFVMKNVKNYMLHYHYNVLYQCSDGSDMRHC